MTACELLDDLKAAGVLLSAQADRLSFDAPAGAMTPERLATLKARKVELLAVLGGDYRAATAALLQRVTDTDDRDALAFVFDERAAIIEMDGNASRADAERAAYIELAQGVEALPAVDPVARRTIEQLDALRPYVESGGAVVLVNPANVRKLVALGLLAEGGIR